DDAFGLAAEALDGEVELAGEPAGCLFPARSRRLLELLLRILGVTRRCSGDDALERVDLAPLDVVHRRLEALRGLVRLAADLLAELLLPARQAVVDLVQRSSALGRVLLDLRGRGGRGVARGCRELLPQSLKRGLLVLARRHEGFCILPD